MDGHRARLDYDDLAESCNKHYQRIQQVIANPGAQLLLDPSCALLPGLDQQLTNSTSLTETSLSDSVEQHRELITADNGDIHFITSLPATALSPSPAQPTAAAPIERQQPGRYHLEYAQGRYTLYPDAGEPPRVNGEIVTAPLQLRVGDVLEGGNGEILQLSTAVKNNGPQT